MEITMTSIQFKIIEYKSPEFEQSLKLREDVLRKPLGLTYSAAELAAERDHVHVAGFLDKAIVVTAVLVPEGEMYKMQRVAVRHDLQNEGIGSTLLAFCEQYAAAEGISTIYCHARDSAVQFYLYHGYSIEGDYFLEDTIPHVVMRKKFS